MTPRRARCAPWLVDTADARPRRQVRLRRGRHEGPPGAGAFHVPLALPAADATEVCTMPPFSCRPERQRRGVVRAESVMLAWVAASLGALALAGGCGGTTSSSVVDAGNGSDATSSSSGSSSGSASSSSSGSSSSSSGTSGSSGGSSSSSGSTSSSGAMDAAVDDSGGGPCHNGTCGNGLKCCGNTCVDENNDPLNCGACGTTCAGSASMCNNGRCTAPTCSPACGSEQQCCLPDTPVGHTPVCVDGPTCPVGCPICP